MADEIQISVQYYCTEEQQIEAKDLPRPFDDWIPLESRPRDNEWAENCPTVGESCTTENDDGYEQICVNRYDEIDESGETFVAGKQCVIPGIDLSSDCDPGMEF